MGLEKSESMWKVLLFQEEQREVEMSDMQFMPKLRDFLNQNGAIYTVRRFKYVITEVHVEGVGRCKRTLIRYVSDYEPYTEQLSNYVKQSGFDSVDEWWVAIRRFIPTGTDMWLFKVVVKR